MFQRSIFRALLLVGILAPLSSCGTSPSLTSITVTPGVMNFGGAGLTTQLTATGAYTHPGHPAELKDITNQVTWASATVQCVTVSSSGLITSQNNTCSNITVSASAPGFSGLISGSMSVNVTQSGGGGGGNPDIASIAIIPNTQSVAAPGDTAQFIAIGTTASGVTGNVTNSSVWSSSSKTIATVTNLGLATAVSQGTSTITAIYTNADGTAATGTATFTVTGGTSEPITALSIIPDSLALSASGQTGQFIALGTSGTTGLIENVTSSSQMTWSSSVPTIATVAAGTVTGVSGGSSTITGQWTNPDGSVVTATGQVTISTTSAPEPLLSLNVVPGTTTVYNKSQIQQYLAFGTYSTAPSVRDLTNKVTWVSLDPEIATINSGGVTGGIGGLATATGYTGLGVIYAETTNPDGSAVLSNPVTFTCLDPNTLVCDQGVAPVQLATLTVYNAGPNTTTWLVTAPSSSGQANLIHCGPGSKSGGSVCEGNYPYGSTVTLTESAPGSSFGGWSANCDSSPNVPDESPTCTVTLNGDSSVGAIFN